MELLCFLLILLVATWFCGEMAEPLGQPSLVLDLIAGVSFGIVIACYSSELQFIDILPHLPNDPVFGAIAAISILFLMLMAGFELSPCELAET